MRLTIHPDKHDSIRWWVLSMLFFATVIGYIDRLTISLLAPVIEKDLGINNLQYAGIATWFLLTYSAFQLFAGRMYDKIGIKKGYTLSITVWSLASVLHAFSKGVTGLSIFRGLLGIGEAGHWPGAIKCIAEWFPEKTRAVAMGIVNAGASVGSILAPPFVIWLLLSFGWKSTFIVTGSLGFLWVILWKLFYRAPDTGKQVPPEQNAVIAAARPDTGASTAAGESESTLPEKPGSLKKLYGKRQLWGITIGRFIGDPIWWLYLLWLPLYLKNKRGFTMEEIGALAWLPYFFAALGGISGGWLSGWLIRKGFSVHRARITAIVIGTLFLPFGYFIAHAPSSMLMWIYISLTLFGFQFWVNNVQTLPSDIFEKKYVGSVAGMAQSGAGFGSMLLMLATGWVVDRFSYAPILFTASLLGPLATLLLILITGKIKKITV